MEPYAKLLSPSGCLSSYGLGGGEHCRAFRLSPDALLSQPRRALIVDGGMEGLTGFIKQSSLET